MNVHSCTRVCACVCVCVCHRYLIQISLYCVAEACHVFYKADLIGVQSGSQLTEDTHRHLLNVIGPFFSAV